MVVEDYINKNKSVKCSFCKKRIDIGAPVRWMRSLYGFKGTAKICSEHSLAEVIEQMFRAPIWQYESILSKEIKKRIGAERSITLLVGEVSLIVIR